MADENGAIISSSCPLFDISTIIGVVRYMTNELMMFQQALMNDNTKRMVIPLGRFWVWVVVSIFPLGRAYVPALFNFVFNIFRADTWVRLCYGLFIL